MKLHASLTGQENAFTAYGDDYIAVNGTQYRQPIVVTAGKVFTDWQAIDFTSLKTEDFAYFVKLTPEVVLVGTGRQQQFPHPQLYRCLIEARISVEFMDTHAACRTYNILVAENRKVVAAILI